MEKRILIVEDSPAMRELIAYAMQGMGGAVLEQAGDGLAALRLLRTQSYALVFLDLNMPVMDGLKLIKVIRAEPKNASLPIVVLTSEESTDTETQARALGANYYLRKPVSRRALERVLTEVLGA